MQRLLLAIACLLFPLSAAADSLVPYPKHDIGFGPGVAYCYQKESGVCANLDLSYTYYLFSASLNAGLSSSDHLRLYTARLELTAYFFVNFGGGVGGFWGDEQGRVYHLFLGLPYGDDWLPDFMAPLQSLYLEPYYRLNLFDGASFQAGHELGLMIKITSFRI